MFKPSTPNAKQSLVILVGFVWGLSVVVPRLQAQGAGWITFEKCTAIVEHAVEVPAQEQGLLESIAVQKNQSVEAGDVLAELDKEVADLQLSDVQLHYEAALERAADTSNLEFKISALEQKKRELRNVQSISNSINQSELDRLKLEVVAGEAACSAARLENAQAERDAKRMANAVRLAQIRLKRCQIKTPLSGIVVDILGEPGEWVEVGEPIMMIENRETLLVNRMISIHQLDPAALKGSEVRADVSQPDGSTVRLSGEIFSYDQHVVSGGLVRVHARIQNTRQGEDWALKPGQEVVLHVAERSQPGDSQARAVVTPNRKVR